MARYSIITSQVPYLIDSETGVVTTAGVFKGLSGTVHEVEVRAFDNFGNLPSLASTAKMMVCVSIHIIIAADFIS